MAAKDSVLLGSDCDETYITEIVDDHLEYLRMKIIECLSKTKQFGGYIQHVPGEPAQMVITLGSEQGIPKHIRSATETKEIRVKNIPATEDRESLHKFFEYEKGYGGGHVNRVTLNNQDHTAIVEFKDAKAVNIVLNNRPPIKMLGVQVDVEAHTPYLIKDETLKTIEVRGLPRDLTEVVAGLNQKANREIRVGDKVRVKRSVPKPMHDWGGVSHDSVGELTKILPNKTALIKFPEVPVWRGSLTEIELAE